MSNLKIKVYKRVLKEVSEKYDGVEDFIKSRTEEICSQEKLFAEEVIYFICFVGSLFSIKIVSSCRI